MKQKLKTAAKDNLTGEADNGLEHNLDFVLLQSQHPLLIIGFILLYFQINLICIKNSVRL